MKIESLIQQTKTLLNHQKEKEKLRGETFNVFSILKMESKENDTHSAFLGELLNPKGSHLKGDLFLRLFFQQIEYEKLDSKSCRVKVEKSIGKIDPKLKKGGRIDIYISDHHGKSISIENKIYATDQNAQIERYFNYNTSSNKVFYLTLDGKDASKESRGKLEAGKDYFTISYKAHILNWLKECLKESHDTPILRETIKQYIILIKKLTLSMNDEDKKRLYDLILSNKEASETIANNYYDAIWSISRSIRKDIIKKLKSILRDEYRILEGADVVKAYSQIWIKIKGKDETKLFFGIESFSLKNQNFTDSLFIGTFVHNGKYKDEYKDLGTKFSDYWINVLPFEKFKGKVVNTRDSETLKLLNSDLSFREGFVNYIVETSVKYIQEYHNKVLSFID